MSELPKIPRIFSNQPIRYATSDKTDGHMSFGHVDDKQTSVNINTFLASLNWPIKGYRYIRVTYDPERTYDKVTIFDRPIEISDKMSLTDRLVADALITNQSYIVLTLPTADCYSATLYDPNHKVLALAHLGWHGTHAHLLKKVIETMKQRFGSMPSDLLVHFDPGIPAKYYVHDKPVQLTLPGWQEHLHKMNNGYEIDLLSYNLEQLSLSGVIGQKIELDPRNTVESDELESHYMHTKQGLPIARRFLTAVMME